MSDPMAISVSGVSKCYHVYEHPWARLGHMLWPAGTTGVSETWALRDVSFEVKKGEAIGIIGRNGSGKSTLLEIIAGTLKATAGTTHSNGRIAALLQLGSGFKPEYTGRENVLLNGLLMGLSRAEVRDRFDAIADFADIGSVLDRPVATYSSGMLVRLAFAVQVALDPDILIVDEALSVGDFFFRQKCFGHIRQLREKGMTLLFVTHDMNTITSICSRALFLDRGELRYDGDPHHAIRAYLGQPRDAREGMDPLASDARPSALFHDPIPEGAQWKRDDGRVPPTGGLLAVCILNTRDEPVSTVPIGGTIGVRVYFAPDPQRKAHIYLQMRNRYDQLIFTSGTYFLDLPIAELSPDRVAVAEFDLEMRLCGGEYSLAVTMGYPGPLNRMGAILDRAGPLGPVIVECQYELEKVPFIGPFAPPMEARLKQSGYEG